MRGVTLAAPFGLWLGLAATALAHGTAESVAASISVQPEARGAAATVDAFHAALRRGDTAGAAALLADDALIFEAGAAQRSKAEYAASHLAADAEFAQAVPTILARRSGGANGGLAWIASEGRVSGTFKGKAVDRASAETMLLRRSGTGWKIVHVHWSSVARAAD